nr:dehydration-responsive element-binding protein 1D-like [Tanacetum cinerariifolium]
MRGPSACLNFADSVWRLPIPQSSDVIDIQKAAAEAAKAFRPIVEIAKIVYELDEDEIFGMPCVIDSMAEGLMLPSPHTVGHGNYFDDVELFDDIRFQLSVYLQPATPTLKWELYEYKHTLVVVVLNLEGDGYIFNTIYVEYEWKPPRCSTCKLFGHSLEQCPKKIVSKVLKNLKAPMKPMRGVPVSSKSHIVYRLVRQNKDNKVKSVPTTGTSFGEKMDKVGLSVRKNKEVNPDEEESKSDVDKGFNETTNLCLMLLAHQIMEVKLGRSNIGYGSSRSSMSDQDSHGLYSSRQGMAYSGAISIPDYLDEYLQMGATIARKFLQMFCKAIMKLYGEEFLRKPTYTDIEKLYAHHEEKHGFPGMTESINCTDWSWENCLVAL